LPGNSKPIAASIAAPRSPTQPAIRRTRFDGHQQASAPDCVARLKPKRQFAPNVHPLANT
jgi:hypothetical protein